MQTELDRFEALLTDLLEISRFDAGAAVLSADVVDLRDIVDRVVEANARLAESHGVMVTVQAAGEAKAEVDARRIERILRNLLVNAIEHSEGKPVDILIASDQLAVAVAVRDHGVGFEASQAKQVFHRFWRADPARARTVGGSGLGLAIAMEDANLHGGWLTAWGRPGLGAQFRLTLPRRLGMVLRTSPLPLVPRDLVSAVGTRVGDRSDRAAPAEPDRRRGAGAGRGGHRAEPRPTRRRCPDEQPTVAFGRRWRLWSCCWPHSPGVSRCRPAGPIEKVEGQQEACQSCVNVEVAPPAAGDDQRQIVEAYLRATSNYQPNYSIARQFLTQAAAEQWSPEDGVSIYRGTPKVDGESVILEGRLVGSLAPDRTYTARDRALDGGLRPGPGGRRVADRPAARGPDGGGVLLQPVLPGLPGLLHRQRHLAGAAADLPAHAAQPGQRRVGVDDGVAGRAVGVAGAGRGLGDPDRHHAQRGLGDHHQLDRRGGAE